MEEVEKRECMSELIGLVAQIRSAVSMIKSVLLHGGVDVRTAGDGPLHLL